MRLDNGEYVDVVGVRVDEAVGLPNAVLRRSCVRQGDCGLGTDAFRVCFGQPRGRLILGGVFGVDRHGAKIVDRAIYFIRVEFHCGPHCHVGIFCEYRTLPNRVL